MDVKMALTRMLLRSGRWSQLAGIDSEVANSVQRMQRQKLAAVPLRHSEEETDSNGDVIPQGDKLESQSHNQPQPVRESKALNEKSLETDRDSRDTQTRLPYQLHDGGMPSSSGQDHLANSEGWWDDWVHPAKSEDANLANSLFQRQRVNNAKLPASKSPKPESSSKGKLSDERLTNRAKEIRAWLGLDRQNNAQSQSGAALPEMKQESTPQASPQNTTPVLKAVESRSAQEAQARRAEELQKWLGLDPSRPVPKTLHFQYKGNLGPIRKTPYGDRPAEGGNSQNSSYIWTDKAPEKTRDPPPMPYASSERPEASRSHVAPIPEHLSSVQYDVSQQSVPNYPGQGTGLQNSESVQPKRMPDRKALVAFAELERWLGPHPVKPEEFDGKKKKGISPESLRWLKGSVDKESSKSTPSSRRWLRPTTSNSAPVSLREGSDRWLRNRKAPDSKIERPGSAKIDPSEWQKTAAGKWIHKPAQLHPNVQKAMQQVQALKQETQFRAIADWDSFQEQPKPKEELGPMDLLWGRPAPAPTTEEPKKSPAKAKKPKPKPEPKAEPEPPSEINLPDEVTVESLAKLLWISKDQIEATMTELSIAFGSDQDLVSPSDAELIAMSYGRTVILSKAVLERNNDAVPRPPVVTIMGHVDHGKTSLLDALRKTRVAAGEAGGITQHIGAFQVEMPDSGGMITFLDTPGHSAFSAMRARGAALTDLVVLVVAADDGVMPQTKEAIQHAKDSGCPIVVALTKCDLPGADPDKAMSQLGEAGLELEAFGGSIPVVQTAAPVGIGLTELEEALLFQAELMELKASQTRPMVGVVVEAKMIKGQGPVATIIVKRGTLKVGQDVVLGEHWGRVKALKSEAGKMLKEAHPGQPVEVSGLRGMPMAGDDFLVQSSEESARKLSEARQLRKETLLARQTSHESASATSSSDIEGEAPAETPKEKQVVIIIKADTQGSAEAIAASLEALSSEIVSVKTIQGGIGAISTNDVENAVSMGARIVGFNVKSATGALERKAKQEKVEITRHTIIYRLLQEVSGWMAEAAPHIEEEKVVGEAEILQTFPLKERRGHEVGLIAGCRVEIGSLVQASTFRVLRSGKQLWQGQCSSIRRHKLEVHQIGKGNECGVVLENFSDFKQGDVLQCFKTELRPQAVENVCSVLHSGKTQETNKQYAVQS